MMDLRQACDRCHNKKLKCHRPSGSPSCSRCSKASVPCLFSPPIRPLRQPYTNNYNSINYHDDQITFDWPDIMAFDHQHQHIIPEHTFEAAVLQTPVDISPKPTLLEQLTALLVALDQILTSLPSSLELHHVSRKHLREYADTVGDNFNLQSTLERLLRHTQDLAQLYPKVTAAATNNRITPAEADEMCVIPDCIHEDRTALQTTPLPKLDHALLNLVMACHIRLLDVLDSMSEHGQMCAFMVATLPKDYDPKFDVPEIRIGSFVAPTTTAASMLVSVLLELQDLLIARVKNVASVVSSTKDDPRASREAKILILQCEGLHERAETTLEQLKKLKTGLVQARVLG